MDGENGGSAEHAQPRYDKNALLDVNGEPIFDQNAWLHFQALERELSNPKVVRCPADPGVQQVTSFSNLSADAISYWLRTDKDVTESRPNEIVAVCPHHDHQFNVLFEDGSVHQASHSKLIDFFEKLSNPIEVNP